VQLQMMSHQLGSGLESSHLGIFFYCSFLAKKEYPWLLGYGPRRGLCVAFLQRVRVVPAALLLEPDPACLAPRLAPASLQRMDRR
jgi:hypothetical protein